MCFNRFHLCKKLPGILAIGVAVVGISLLGCKGKSAYPAGINTVIDKDNAFRIVTEIVMLGPRPSGSSNALKTADYLREKCIRFGYQPTVEEWNEETPFGKITFRNVYATLKGKGDKFIIVASHYDTKNLPSTSNFVGANDSASSTGLLLEIMRVLKEKKWNGTTIRFAFFDGEEAQKSYAENDGLHGSKRLAKQLKESGDYNRCRAMILLDMVGDKDLTITMSPDDDKELTQLLFSVADRQKTRQYFGFFLHGTILDDHVPFKKLGIPALDIIDFNYGPNNYYWHTDLDTLDKLSPDSLEIIGNVTLGMLAEL